MKQRASGPLRANERKRWRRSDDCLGPRGLLCLHFSAPARRGEGLKGQSCSTSGTTMEARTILTQKKKKRKRNSATFSKSGVSWQEEPTGLQSIVAAPTYCKVEHKELKKKKKKRKILSIDHQAPWQRQLCGVCHRKFSSSRSAIKDADAELNPFKGQR